MDLPGTSYETEVFTNDGFREQNLTNYRSRVLVEDDFDVANVVWDGVSSANNVNTILSDDDDENGGRRTSRRLRSRRMMEDSITENVILNVGSSAVASGSNVSSPKTPSKRRAKRKSVADADLESAKRSAEFATNVEDECLCPICYVEYSAGGAHRLISLKCGHLFGRSCIEQWIRVGRNNTCPTCKSRAKMADVRNIFATKLQVTDNDLVDSLKKSNESLQKQTECMTFEIKSLKKDLQSAHEFIRKLFQTRQHIPRFLIALGEITYSCLRISNEIGARCFDHSQQNESIVVGIPVVTTKPPSFGLKRLFHSRSGVVVSGIHSKSIRCCRISPFLSDIVLTTGEDRYACITDFRQSANKLRYRFHLDAQGWCCDWINLHSFVVGQMNGRVMLYSIFENSLLHTLGVETDYSPDTVSLDQEPMDMSLGNGRVPIFHVEWLAEHQLLFIVSLRSVAIHCNEEYKTLIENKGAIQSFNYDSTSRQFMVSFAPSANGNKFIMFSLYELNVDLSTKEVRCERIKEWTTKSDMQTFLTRYAMWSPIVSSSSANEFYASSDCIYQKYEVMPKLAAVYDQNRMELVVIDWNTVDSNRNSDACAIERFNFGKPVKQIGISHNRGAWGNQQRMEARNPGEKFSLRTFVLIVLSEEMVHFIECRLERKSGI